MRDSGEISHLVMNSIKLLNRIFPSHIFQWISVKRLKITSDWRLRDPEACLSIMSIKLLANSKQFLIPLFWMSILLTIDITSKIIFLASLLAAGVILQLNSYATFFFSWFNVPSNANILGSVAENLYFPILLVGPSQDVFKRQLKLDLGAFFFSFFFFPKK